MKLTIIGDGAFGSFMKELLMPHFNICDDADSVMLAIPLSAYDEVAKKYKDKHLINVCSVQSPTTITCLKYSDRVTSIHPLFGRRTPADKRNSILTFQYAPTEDTWLSEDDLGNTFTDIFSNVSPIHGNYFTPEEHDILMAKTHVAAVMGAQQLKVFVDRVKNVPDKFIPNSFRLMRDFVKTLEDMPQGTTDSIMANPYI